MRFLKGHGRDYAFDAATWRHYRRCMRALACALRCRVSMTQSGRAPSRPLPPLRTDSCSWFAPFCMPASPFLGCRQKLSKTELFKVLRPFHDNDEKLQVWGERLHAWISAHV